MKMLKVLILTTLLAGLVACSGNAINVTAEFSNTQDIKEGASVFFDGKKIGEVSDVDKNGTGSVVELELKHKATELVSARSAIVVNRIKAGSPIELYGRPSATDEKLEDGQKIKGLDSMFQLGAWMVGDAIQTGSDSVAEYVGAFQEYLSGDEFQQSKEVVQEQLSNLSQSAAEVVKDVEKEMSTAMKEFSINEEQMAQTIEQLGDELAPVVSEVAKSSTELVQQLEQFIVNIEESANLMDQQSGEKILESLAETFEKLNESIEEGASEGLKLDDKSE